MWGDGDELMMMVDVCVCDDGGDVCVFVSCVCEIVVMVCLREKV